MYRVVSVRFSLCRMESARGPVSEAGAAAAGGFSRQAGTQGKASCEHSWAAAFGTRVASTPKPISEDAWLQSLLPQRRWITSPVDMAFRCPGRGGLPLVLLDKLSF